MCVFAAAAAPALAGGLGVYGSLGAGAAAAASIASTAAAPVITAGTAAAAGASAFSLSSLFSQGFGTILQAFGQMAGGNSESAMYKYQAAVDRNNKIMADWQAQDAIARGQEEESKQRMKINMLKSDQRTAFADRGIDLGSESVANTVADTAFLGEIDALTIRSNAEREAYGYKQQGSNYAASATMNTMAAKNAKSAGMINATSTILGGITKVGDSWYDYKTAGAL